MEKIEITHSEFNDIIHDVSDRFTSVFNDIPLYHPEHKASAGETHRDYIEDDGREYRLLIIKDKSTEKEYSLSYAYHSEFGPSFPFDMDQVSIINDSPKAQKEEKVELIQEQKEDALLWESYEKSEKKEFKPGLVPSSVIRDICAFLKQPQFTMLQLRAKIIPVCIEYGVEQKSFWRHIQSKAYNTRTKHQK